MCPADYIVFHTEYHRPVTSYRLTGHLTSEVLSAIIEAYTTFSYIKLRKQSYGFFLFEGHLLSSLSAMLIVNVVASSRQEKHHNH